MKKTKIFKTIMILMLVFGLFISVASGLVVVNAEDGETTIEHHLEHVLAKDPTCTEKGNYEYYYCNDCNTYFKSEAATDKFNSFADTQIKELGHNITDKAVKKDPTCTEPGTWEYWYCSRCGVYFKNANYNAQFNSFEDTIIPKLGHNHIVKESRAATCTVKGYIKYVCERCKDTYVENVDEIEHNYRIVDTLNPTCTSTGYKKYICDGCNDTYSVPLERLAHEFKHVAAVEATCTEDGNYEYWYCDSCRYYYKTQAAKDVFRDLQDTVIKATGHDAVHMPAKKATNTEEGWNEHWYCEKCDSYFKDVYLETELREGQVKIPAKGVTNIEGENNETVDKDGHIVNSPVVSEEKENNSSFWIATIWGIFAIAVCCAGFYIWKKKSSEE